MVVKKKQLDIRKTVSSIIDTFKAFLMQIIKQSFLALQILEILCIFGKNKGYPILIEGGYSLDQLIKILGVKK